MVSRRKQWLAGIAIAVAARAPAFGQAESARAQLLHPAGGTAPAFEVVAVKQARASEQVYSLRMQPDRFIAEGAPLDRLIRFAYDVKSDRQVLGMPPWAASERFDIDAKIADQQVEAIKKLAADQGFQQYRLMVQSLLADRFQLNVRIERRELPVYALARAKKGPKLVPTAITPDTQKLLLPQLHFTAEGELSAVDVSMPFLVGWLSGRPDTGDRVVIDETGLQGSYDFALKWSPVLARVALASGNQASADASQANDDRPALFTALQEQLGLKLKPKKALVEVMVIEGVAQPSAN